MPEESPKKPKVAKSALELYQNLVNDEVMEEESEEDDDDEKYADEDDDDDDDEDEDDEEQEESEEEEEEDTADEDEDEDDGQEIIGGDFNEEVRHQSFELVHEVHYRGSFDVALTLADVFETNAYHDEMHRKITKLV